MRTCRCAKGHLVEIADNYNPGDGCTFDEGEREMIVLDYADDGTPLGGTIPLQCGAVLTAELARRDSDRPQKDPNV